MKHLTHNRVAIQLRLPRHLHAELVKLAKANGRSLNSEIIQRLLLESEHITQLPEKRQRDWLVP